MQISTWPSASKRAVDRTSDERVQPAAGARCFLVREMRRVVLVDEAEVDWIGAEGNYVRLYRGAASQLLRSSMTALERRLDPQRFVRIHRSAFVRLDRVREYSARPSGDYEVVLRDGRRLTLSRGYRERFLGAVAEWAGKSGDVGVRGSELHIHKFDDERLGRLAKEEA